jgi:hypothetical protein
MQETSGCGQGDQGAGGGEQCQARGEARSESVDQAAAIPEPRGGADPRVLRAGIRAYQLPSVLWTGRRRSARGRPAGNHVLVWGAGPGAQYHWQTLQPVACTGPDAEKTKNPHRSLRCGFGFAECARVDSNHWPHPPEASSPSRPAPTCTELSGFLPLGAVPARLAMGQCVTLFVTGVRLCASPLSPPLNPGAPPRPGQRRTAATPDMMRRAIALERRRRRRDAIAGSPTPRST